MKYTAEQREEIKSWILELHLVGIRKTREVRQVLSEKKNFQISDRHLRRLREDVRQETIKSSKFDRDEQVGTAIARLESLYRKCIGDDDYRAALAVQREIDELLGLKVLHIEHSAKTPFATWLQDLKPPKPNGKESTNGKKASTTGASGGEAK